MPGPLTRRQCWLRGQGTTCQCTNPDACRGRCVPTIWTAADAQGSVALPLSVGRLAAQVPHSLNSVLGRVKSAAASTPSCRAILSNTSTLAL